MPKQDMLENAWPISLSFGLAMILTRGFHGGDLLHLPDASTAIFFLGGLYLRRWNGFAGLVLFAVLIDAVATQFAGVSSFCITPAYSLLLPAYAALWLGGRLLQPGRVLSVAGLAGVCLSLVISTVVAHELSSGGFYLLSGYFEQPEWSEYLARARLYLPGYLFRAALYVTFGLSIHWLLRRLNAMRTQARAKI